MIILIAFLFVALLGRLIYIEVVIAKDLQAKALDQWMRDVPLQAERGDSYNLHNTKCTYFNLIEFIPHG